VQNAQSVYLETVKSLLEENEVEKALDALRELDQQANAGIWQDLIMQYSNYRSSAKAQREGRISFDEFRRYEAQTRYAVLELMKEIPRRIALNAKVRDVGTFQFEVPDEAHLEKIIGQQSPILRINWLERALQASKAVCRVVCADGSFGTGFLTKEGYVFTNNHVLPSAADAKAARIEFNYEVGLDGKTKSRTAYDLDASDFKTSTPDQLDFARVRVIDRADAPLSQWGSVEFDPDAVPSVGEAVTIIQHPKGEDKQIALNANEVLGQLNQHIFYSTNTEPGSSGSPVFNQDWKVVAIHHAGRTDAEGGLVINARGERRGANRGVLFREIFKNIGGKPTASVAAPPANQESFAPPAQPEPSASGPSTASPKQPPAPRPLAAVPKFLVVYDMADSAQCQLLNKHLNVLKITKKIRVYNVHEALAGEEPFARAEQELADADYILALVTVNLFGSAEWFGLVFSALEAGRRVIPIRVEKADFEGTGLDKLKTLPSVGRAVSDFPTANDAYADIATELKKLL
jgi:V8-like Glu-specific endopeptidase